jgi:short-subunit dehydrogenase
MTRARHRFKGQVVVVTGGSSGIGLQLASDFAALAANVIVTSHDSARLEDAVGTLRERGRTVTPFHCDVRDASRVEALAQFVKAQWGRIDILVNNAGFAVYRPFDESSTAEILDLLDVNLGGAMRCARAFLPQMIAQGTGRIVNIASIGGSTIITPNAVYCAAKHGMVAWTLAIRYELEPLGVKVSVVCPGHTLTRFHDHPTFRRRDADRDPRVKSLAPEDVSAAVLDALCRDRVITYVPSWHRFLVWALRAAPLVSGPIWDRIARRRIAQLRQRIAEERPRTQA